MERLANAIKANFEREKQAAYDQLDMLNAPPTIHEVSAYLSAHRYDVKVS